MKKSVVPGCDGRAEKVAVEEVKGLVEKGSATGASAKVVKGSKTETKTAGCREDGVREMEGR